MVVRHVDEIGGAAESSIVDQDVELLVFVLIYVDWCPHCKTIKPDWKNLVNNHNNTKVNGKNVQVVSVNAEGSEVEREVANDLNAKGYPTIKVLKK